MSILRCGLTYRAGKHPPHTPPLLVTHQPEPHHNSVHPRSATSPYPAGEGTEVHRDPTAKKEETLKLNRGLSAPKPGLFPGPQPIPLPG